MFDVFEDVEHVHFPGYIVYRYTNLVNGKMYVGVTSQGSISARAKGTDKYAGSRHINAAIKKYGWTAFKKEIFFYGCTKEEAEECEKELIAYFDLTNPKKGYNIQKGGLSSGGLSDTGRKRLVELNTGGKSPVALPVISFSSEGKKLMEFDCLKDAEVFYGLPLATLTLGSRMGSSPRGGYYFRRKKDVGDITQLPMSEMKPYNDRSVFVGSKANHAIPVVLFDKNTGKRIAEFGCAKDASAFAGTNVLYCMEGVNKTCGDYICYKACEVVGVDVLPNLDVHKPKPNGKKVAQYSISGDFISEYRTAREAQEKTGVSYKMISNCVRGKCKTGGGYIWRYYDK